LTSNAAPVLCSFIGQNDSSKIPMQIFKSGDELGQDHIVLAISRELFNRSWREDGIDAEIITYNVSSLGDRVGMIEVVPGCTSLGVVQGNT
jgi:phosphatidylinositol kinase/protein kinase (PI-3  family)